MPKSEHKTIVERWFREIFEQGNYDTVDEIVAEDFTAYPQGPGEPARGRETFKQWLDWYRSSFTEQEWTIHDIISEGNKVVVRYTGYTTYRGGLFDILSENQRILETGILIYRIENGQVQELWAEMSDLQVVMQLGAFPCPSDS
jgi:predicted ester cyclase